MNLSDTDHDRKPVDVAKEYAEQGMQVLPMYSVNGDGSCGCGKPNCGSRAKHPATAHGYRSATKDPAEIERMFARNPNYNIGIATGRASGRIVVDIDPRNGGDLALLDELPPTQTVETGGDGLQLHYLYPEEKELLEALLNVFRGMEGVDVLADGKIAIMPNSRHASGQLYRCMEGRSLKDGPPADITDWVLKVVAEGDGEGEEAKTLPPIDDLLKEVGATDLGKKPSAEDRQRVLDALVPRLKKADARYVALVRTELIHTVGLPANEVDTWLHTPAPDTAAEDTQGRSLAVRDPEPWPQPVDGSELLFEVAQVFRRFLVLPPGGLVLIPLWDVFTHASPAFFINPYLALTSPVIRCGKSTAETLLKAVCRRPVVASNLTPATLFRVVDLYQPTLLIDEGEWFLHNRELRGMLNAGHSRHTSTVLRCVGEDHEPRGFDVFCPKSIALIGRLPPTLSDRSIELRMRRKARKEKVERLRLDRLLDFEELRRKAWRWALDNFDVLKGADPDVPDQLDDRQADNWSPLLSIADQVGGPWPEMAREAAVILSNKQLDEDVTEEGVRLLQDIQTVFVEERKPQLATSEIIHGLKSRGREWEEYRSDGRPLTAIQLAKLLRAFQISSRDLWFPNLRVSGGMLKGYRREDFQDAWARYLPQAESPGEDPHEPHGASDHATI